MKVSQGLGSWQPLRPERLTVVPGASGKASGSPALARETLPSTLARGCVPALEAPMGEVVIGWKQSGPL